VIEAELHAVLNTLTGHDFREAFKNGRNAGNIRVEGEYFEGEGGQ
jgi:hypothetical protein